jgi:hypothetical protein
VAVAYAQARRPEAGRHICINLWSYGATDGATIAKAVDFLIPAAIGQSAWTYRDLDVFNPSMALDKIHAAATEGGDANATAALAKVPAPSGGDLWPIVLVCWGTCHSRLYKRGDDSDVWWGRRKTVDPTTRGAPRARKRARCRCTDPPNWWRSYPQSCSP